MLATLGNDKAENWLEYLPQVLYAYRTAYHASLQDSPFFMLYGRDPRSTSGLETLDVYGIDSVTYRSSLTERIEYARKILLENMKAAAAKASMSFNKNARENSTLQGLVLCVVHSQPNSSTHIPVKLRNKFDSPYRIIRQVADLTYDIQLVGSQKILRAHRRTLKPYFTREDISLPQDVYAPSDLTFEVAQLIDSKWDDDLKQLFYKVRWKGYTQKNDTWEPLDALIATATDAIKDFHAKNTRTASVALVSPPFEKRPRVQ